MANIFLLLIDQSILSQAVLRDLHQIVNSDAIAECYCFRIGSMQMYLLATRVVGLTFCSAEILRITNDTTCRMVIKKENLSRHSIITI